MDTLYNWEGKTILIVEDDEPSYLYTSVLFKNQNAEVIRSSDGLDGFFLCMTAEPDLIIMDIRLPVLNGIETIKLIKKYQPRIPIITISAGAMKDEQHNCIIAGSDAFVSKPVLPDDLLPVVDYFLMKQNAKGILAHAKL